MEKIKQNRWFQTEIDGKLYNCIIWQKSGLIDYIKLYYITVVNYEYVNYKFLWWEWKESTNKWTYDYQISTRIIKPELINEMNYFQIEDVKCWVNDAIFDRNKEIQKEEIKVPNKI